MPDPLGSPVANPIPLVVIPCLNEAEHIARVAQQMLAAVARHGGLVVVVDGGSTDGPAPSWPTWRARRPPAPARQSRTAAGQRRQRRRGRLRRGHTHLIRVDAHSLYPDDFVDILLAEATGDRRGLGRRGHDRRGRGRGCSVSTPRRRTRGSAMAGRAHRARGQGAFVDHGHHALMSIAAFRAVGGYDPDFAHNEDAELDHRLRAAGYDIWLTGGRRSPISRAARFRRWRGSISTSAGAGPPTSSSTGRAPAEAMGGDLGRSDALAAWLAPQAAALARRRWSGAASCWPGGRRRRWREARPS
jgi:hypothetical protein